MSVDPEDLVREYYQRIDGEAYEALRDLLADEFVQYRADRTLEGADSFVRFMREERPDTDTTHAVEYVYRAVGTASAGEADAAGTRVAVEGRLERASGETWFRFVDSFVAREGLLWELRTYTV